MSESKVYLKEVSEQFSRTKKAYDAWQMSQGTNVPYGGAVVKAVDNDLREEFQRLIDVTADAGKEVEEKARRAVMVLDDFALKYARWLRQAAIGNESPRGSDDMWRAWEHVVVAFQPLNENRPQSVKYLVDVAEAPREQIARMYGWYDEFGEPDLAKVQEEYDSPGTHYKSETWVSPAIRGHQERVNEEWKARQSVRKPLFRPVVSEDEANAKPPAEVPSMDELLKLDAPPEQIARLHKITLDEAIEVRRIYQEEKGLAEVEVAKAKAKAGGKAR